MKNKIKTHKATSKRFSVTGSGKVAHNHQKDNDHLKIGKTRAQKARVNGKGSLSATKEIKKIKRLASA
jgi:ribosomal protein L35